MAVTRRASRSRFTLLLLILTSATLVTLDLRGFAPLDDVRTSALDVFGPVKDAANDAFDPVGNAWDGALNYDDLEADNEELRERIAELEGELALVADAKVTLQDLYGELDLEYVGDIETVVARVASGPISNFEHRIEIDKGAEDGVVEGMPVVSSAGLVGTIQDVADERSVVRLVTDPGFRVGVRIADPDADDVGVARGQGRDQPLLVFQGIDIGLEIPDDVLVTTSGLAGTLFPSNVPVGHVTNVVTARGELDQDLLVEPLADLDALSFVNVMLWLPEDP